jgi:hypothetical protein
MKNVYIFVLALIISASAFAQENRAVTVGDGSFDSPFDVATAVSNNVGTNVWVNGFIVGNIEVGADNLANLSAPFTTNTNLYIAASASETDTTQMLIVQLSTGVRDATNLVDNPGNLGQEIKFRGDLQAYFTVAGLKSTDGYWMNGAGINPELPADLVVLGTSAVVPTLNATFADAVADQDYLSAGWLNINMLGERYWIGKEFDGNQYLQFSGYGATYDNLESWIVTPGVDLTASHVFSFDTKVGYWKHAALTVYVSVDFDGSNGSLFSATWNDITPAGLPTEPTSGYGDWENFEVDLSAYNGQTVYVMFKYTGDNSNNTTTVQIDNVLISNNVSVNEVNNSNAELTLYPNPSQGAVKIDYSVEQASNVKISIYALNGQLVETVLSEEKAQGSYSLNWSNASLQSGTYIVKVKTGNTVKVNKLVLTK